jgi:hypothetical protein
MRPGEVAGVAGAFAPLGLAVRDRIDDDGWSTVLLAA